MIFPLLYVFAGHLFKDLTRKQWIFMGALGLYQLISVLSYYPNYLGYFNEIVWDRKTAYQYLADSNLDWGQDYYALKDYRAEHRNLDKAPEVPALINKTKTYFVPVNQLVGVSYDPVTYKWLRDNFEPVGTIGSSYLLFEITAEEMKNLCEKTAYCK